MSESNFHWIPSSPAFNMKSSDTIRLQQQVPVPQHLKTIQTCVRTWGTHVMLWDVTRQRSTSLCSCLVALALVVSWVKRASLWGSKRKQSKLAVAAWVHTWDLWYTPHVFWMWKPKKTTACRLKFSLPNRNSAASRWTSRGGKKRERTRRQEEEWGRPTASHWMSQV